MLLRPPGPLDPASLPHWPYAQELDRELTHRGIAPGAVRVERTYWYESTMRLVLTWDASRCAGSGGIRLVWQDDTGWSHSLLRPDAVGAIPRGPLTALHRVFATPHDVAEVAGALVTRRFHRYTGDHHEEWEQAPQVRAAIDTFHLTVGAGRTSR